MSATNGRNFVGDLGVFLEHLLRGERFGFEQHVRDCVFFLAGVLDVLLKQLLIEQVGNAQPATSHLVFIGRPDAARGGSNLHPSGSVFARQLHHAMVGKNDMRPVAHEQIGLRACAGALDADTRRAQGLDFLHQRHRVQHQAIADHGFAARAQNAARNQLKDKLGLSDGNRVAGIVAAAVAGHQIEIVREHINDLSLALVAPLGAHDDRSFCFVHVISASGSALPPRCKDSHTGSPHSSRAYIDGGSRNRTVYKKFYLD